MATIRKREQEGWVVVQTSHSVRVNVSSTACQSGWKLWAERSCLTITHLRLQGGSDIYHPLQQIHPLLVIGQISLSTIFMTCLSDLCQASVPCHLTLTQTLWIPPPEPHHLWSVSYDFKFLVLLFFPLNDQGFIFLIFRFYCCVKFRVITNYKPKIKQLKTRIFLKQHQQQKQPVQSFWGYKMIQMLIHLKHKKKRKKKCNTWGWIQNTSSACRSEKRSLVNRQPTIHWIILHCLPLKSRQQIKHNWRHRLMDMC